MGVAIFNFLIECVTRKACMFSNEKYKSLFLTCAMYKKKMSAYADVTLYRIY